MATKQERGVIENLTALVETLGEQVNDLTAKFQVATVTVKETVTTPPTTALAMLELVESFLMLQNVMTESSEQQKFWDIMTAMRSYDADIDDTSKRQTTVPIRRAAFPKLVDWGRSKSGWYDRSRGAARGMWLGDSGSYLYVPPNSYGHHSEHVKSAVAALRAIGREVPEAIVEVAKPKRVRRAGGTCTDTSCEQCWRDAEPGEEV